MLEVGDCLLQINAGALVPVITTLEIQIVSLTAACRLLAQMALVCARESKSQLVGNFPRNLLLNGGHVRHLAVILLAPHL